MGCKKTLIPIKHQIISATAKENHLIQRPKQYSEEQLLRGIRNHDNQILKYVYKEYRPAIRLLVYRMGGNWADAKDVFQDGVVELLKIVADPAFIPKSSVKTLLYAICKNLWRNNLRRRNKELPFEIPVHKDLTEPEFPEYNDIELYESLFWTTFKFLPETCRKVLLLFWREYTHHEISRLLNRSEGYVRKRKSMCTRKFIEMDKTHKDYVLLTR